MVNSVVRSASVYGFMLLCLLIVGCTHQPALQVGEEITIQPKTFSFSAPDFEHLAEYQLVPGDQLDVLFQIQIWSPENAYQVSLGDTVAVDFPLLPELNTSQKVLPDGTIAMPYIGQVKVYGKTTTELTQDLKKAYSEILVSPVLHVSVPNYLSQIRELKNDLHTSSRGLSRLVTVRPDGYVTFPMLGDVFVSSKSLPEVKNIINDKYHQVSSSLHVDLFLEKHSGSMVYMMGEVNKPGGYKITKAISVLQALAMAEGYSRDALLSDVYIIRRQEKTLVATRVDVSNTLQLNADAHLFYLLPDDIVYVPARPISQAAQIARQIADVLMFRGWGVGFNWQLHDAASSNNN